MSYADYPSPLSPSLSRVFLETPALPVESAQRSVDMHTNANVRITTIMTYPLEYHQRDFEGNERYPPCPYHKQSYPRRQVICCYCAFNNALSWWAASTAPRPSSYYESTPTLRAR
ncbi:unnamed protein product [Ectocarpus sp. 12 AP-2014]